MTAPRRGARTVPSFVKAEGQQPINLPPELLQEFGAIFHPGLGLAQGFVHRVKTRATVLPVAS